MKATFNFTPKFGYNLRDVMGSLADSEDFKKYLQEMSDTELVLEIKPAAKLSPKQRMYNYYHKVVLGVAMQAYTDDGWEAVDKEKADHLLKQECAMELMYNEKEDREESYPEDKSKMNKKRLAKFVTDCILVLHNKGYQVPESDEYLHFMQTGEMGFKSVSNNKF